MNDHEAMEAINAALDEYFASEMTRETLVCHIAYISGMNHFEHAKAKEEQS